MSVLHQYYSVDFIPDMQQQTQAQNQAYCLLWWLSHSPPLLCSIEPPSVLPFTPFWVWNDKLATSSHGRQLWWIPKWQTLLVSHAFYRSWEQSLWETRAIDVHLIKGPKLLALKPSPVLVFVRAFRHRSKIVKVQFASLFISSLLKVGYGKVFVRFQEGISAYPRFL